MCSERLCTLRNYALHHNVCTKSQDRTIKTTAFCTAQNAIHTKFQKYQFEEHGSHFQAKYQQSETRTFKVVTLTNADARMSQI